MTKRNTTPQSQVRLFGEFAPVSALWSGARPAFPSEQSARWALRQHRTALAEGNALALCRGRLLVHPERFARVLEARGIEAANERAKRGAA